MMTRSQQKTSKELGKSGNLTSRKVIQSNIMYIFGHIYYHYLETTDKKCICLLVELNFCNVFIHSLSYKMKLKIIDNDGRSPCQKEVT